jgi:mediator of RNA polymerase II transcription subunit 21
MLRIRSVTTSNDPQVDRRARSNMRVTPRNTAATIMNRSKEGTQQRPRSTGRLQRPDPVPISMIVASHQRPVHRELIDYDDPDEVAKAIMSLREQRAASRPRGQNKERSKSRQRQTPSPTMRQSPAPDSYALKNSTSQLSKNTTNSARSSQQGAVIQHALSSTSTGNASSLVTGPLPQPPPPQQYSQARQHQYQRIGGGSPPILQLPHSFTLKSPNSSSVPAHPNPHGLRLHTSSPMSPNLYNNNDEDDSPSSLSRALQSLLSPHSQLADEQANETLKKAEDRIDGLLQELEELRFFQELDQAPKNSSPVKKRLGAMKSPSPPHNASPPLLNPRTISQLDRTSLELETQTLVRRIQVCASEKLALQAEMDVLQKAHAGCRPLQQRVHQLEGHVQHASAQLRQTKTEMKQVRARMVQEYESQLQENIEKLQSTQSLADSLQAERDKLRKELEKRRHQLTEQKSKYMEELTRQQESAQSHEAVFELQMTEVQSTVEILRNQMKVKDGQIQALQQELDDVNTTIGKVKESKDAAYEVRLSSLQEQLFLAQNKFEKATQEREQLNGKLKALTTQLDQANKQSDEHIELISDMTKRLDSVHHEYRKKFAELKTVFEAKEKRRLNEMVAMQATEVAEFERRIKSLQEQLAMATDRHHAEILQKETDLEARLKSERDLAGAETEKKYAPKLEAVMKELEVTKQELEHANRDRKRLRDESMTPSQEQLMLQREWEEKEARYEREMQQLRETIDRQTRTTSEKEEMIEELSKKLSEREKKHIAIVNRLEEKHVLELNERDEHIAEHKKKVRTVEMHLQDEKSRQEADLSEINALMQTRVGELENELNLSKEALADARKAVEEGHNTTRRVEELQTLLQSVQSELITERSSLQIVQSELTTERSSLQIVQSELTTERLSHESSMAEMCVEIDRLEGTIRAGEFSLEHERSRIEILEARLQRETEESDLLAHNLQREVKSLQTQLHDADSLVQNERIVVVNHAKMVADLKAENDELRRKAEMLDEAQIAMLSEHEIVEQKIAEITRLRQANDDLQVQVNELDAARLTIHKLQSSLTNKEDEKMCALVELSRLRDELKNALQNLTKYEDEVDKTSQLSLSLERELANATRTSDEYKVELEDLQRRLELEQRQNQELEAKIIDHANDIELKQQQLNGIPRREEELKEISGIRDSLLDRLGILENDLETKSDQLASLQEYQAAQQNIIDEQLAESQTMISAFESQLRTLGDEIQVKNDRVERLQAQINDLDLDFTNEAERSQRFENQLAGTKHLLDERTQEVIDLKVALDRATSALKENEIKMSELRKQGHSTLELHDTVDQLTRTKAHLEAKIVDLEEESDEREAVMRESTTKYSDQLIDLQMQVENLIHARESLQTKLAKAESDLEEKEDFLSAIMSKHNNEVKNLRSNLSEQVEARSKLQSLSEELEMEVARVQRESRNKAELAVADLQRQVEVVTKESRSLKLKVGDIEHELERKEKQIKDVVNRYSKEIAELNDALACQSKENRTLHRELERTKDGNVAFSDLSNETDTLKARINSLEKSVEMERAISRDHEDAKKRLDAEFVAATSAKQELEERYAKVSKERNEVITALEEVINEVQSREDEIDALAVVIRNRETELEHAKLIATRALSQAQEIKTKYRERGANSELEKDVFDLNSQVDQLKKKNESLQSKLSRLEEELTRREGECSELHDQIRRVDINSASGGKMDLFVTKMKRNFDSAIIETASTAASTAFSATSGNYSALSSDKPTMHESPSPSSGNAAVSTQSAELAVADSWIDAFDSESVDSSEYPVSFSEIRGESIDKSSIERDALRKYVRKRYMNSRATTT